MDSKEFRKVSASTKNQDPYLKRIEGGGDYRDWVLI